MKETRTIIDDSDVVGIIAVCTKCGGEAHMKRGNDVASRFPGNCPLCGAVWRPHSVVHDLDRWVDVLNGLGEANRNSTALKVRLELTPDPGKGTVGQVNE